MASEERENPGAGDEKDKEYPGRTVHNTASSYSSTGGGVRRAPRRGDESAPAPEDVEGVDLPYAGEGASTRGSTFGENPDTGRTPAEEEEAILTETLEKRTRAYESG